MKILDIKWLGQCNSCGNETLKVETEKGVDDLLYEGDKVTCPNCGEVGEVGADGVDAWIEWEE